MTEQRNVVVGTFPDAMAAHLCRMRLDAEGIESYLRDENIASIYPLYANAVGGVKLLVEEGDAHTARQIITGIDADNQADRIRCPECGSTYVGENATGLFRTLVLTIITIGLFLPFFYRRRKCNDCGHVW